MLLFPRRLNGDTALRCAGLHRASRVTGQQTHAARASTAALAIPALKYFLHEYKYFSPDITFPRCLLFTSDMYLLKYGKIFITLKIFLWLATGVWKYPQSSSVGRLSHFTTQPADKTPPDLCSDIGLYVSPI